MPNWCNNSITLRHADPEMIDRAYNALQQGQLLQTFVPCPEELLDPETTTWSRGPEQEARDEKKRALVTKYGFESWYDWCVANWGTKWDVGGGDCFAEKTDSNTLEASFDSAWAPPTNAYAQLCELGFDVTAYYNEPGMCFCGKFTGDKNGHDDNYYEYNGETSSTVREAIGEELDDFFNISEDMESWEEENEE